MPKIEFWQSYKKFMGDLHEIEGDIANNSTIALAAGTVIHGTSESIFKTKAIFDDPESTPGEKAAGILGIFSSFTMAAGAFTPIGVGVGAVLSSLLDILQQILMATAYHRKYELSEMERTLRKLGAENVAHEVGAARSLVAARLAVVRAFEKGSRDWHQVDGYFGGASDFALAKTVGWLMESANQQEPKWESVFTGYAQAVMQVIELQVTLMSRLKPQDVQYMLSHMEVYGDQVARDFEALRDAVDRCGKYYFVGADTFGYFFSNTGHPQRSIDGSRNLNIGEMQAFSISNRNRRVWAYRAGGDRVLATGSERQGFKVHDLAHGAATGCVDLGLWPWATPHAELLFLAVTKPNPLAIDDQVPLLIMNEWVEHRGRFYSEGELKRDTSLGFGSAWRRTKFSKSGGGATMARVFRAQEKEKGGKPKLTADGLPIVAECVYIVRARRQHETEAENPQSSEFKYNLSFMALGDFIGESGTDSSIFEIPLPQEYWGAAAAAHYGDIPFRISTTSKYLYLYTNRGVWRSTHAQNIMLAPERPKDWKSDWQRVTLPDEMPAVPSLDRFDDRTIGRWKSNGLSELQAWADDHVVAVIDEELWNGDFYPPNELLWADFALLHQPDGPIAEGGQSLVFITEPLTQVNRQNVSGWWNPVHIRIFDTEGERVVDTDETRLLNRPALPKLKAQLHQWREQKNVIAVLRSFAPKLQIQWRAAWDDFDVLALKDKDIPLEGQSLIVVALQKGRLHLQIFDADGDGPTSDETVVKDDPALPGLKQTIETLSKLSRLTDKDVIATVRALVGPSWRWSRMREDDSDRAYTLTKYKSDSFNYCRRLIEAGNNWRAVHPAQ